MSESGLFERIRFGGKPAANPESVVVSGECRFTVLTPRLLRLEWSESGEFEDRATYAFPTRYVETPPPFTVQADGDDLVIDTGVLTLRYVQGSGRFTEANLSIALHSESWAWRPGKPDPLNLRGTRRTLDFCDGDAALGKGLLSRGAWALFDDSANVVFNLDDGWVAPRPNRNLQDWYFLSYGQGYDAALRDYVQFGGKTPLIPRFILGAWWSRYWAYSAQDLKDLVHQFEMHDLPLDVLVIDMDWHTPDSWTGYTWNRELFPDPPGFLEWVHKRGLRTTLNLHPAEGVQAFEEVYPEFAEAMGVDPESGEPVRFRITDKRFVKHYFELLHHSLEDDGVDFWWIDWQQGETSEMKGLDPLPWLNHLHFNDSRRNGERPMLYSRWGGLGSHRYYVGFSGDTYETWDTLQFQPYFTATAANVAFGWWSHDIGGHMGGTITPELYARWVQYGVLSPILRLHATKDPRCERRPWAFTEEVYRVAQRAFRLRYRLVPYLYTMARINTDTGVPLCRPMYYEYPEADAAYVARYQYFFGDQMIAAPIVHPAGSEIGLAAQDVWVPEGLWIDYGTKEAYTGPRWVRLVGDLDRMPMLMKAGAILPLAPGFEKSEGPRLASGTIDALPKDRLILSVFPGDGGVFRLYEDGGTTEAYRDGDYEWTEIRAEVVGESTWEVHVAPVEGRCSALPRARGYEIRLEGTRRPARVLLDGEETTDWIHDGLTTIIRVPKRDKRKPVRLTAIADGEISALGDEHNRTVIAADVRRLLGDACPDDPLDLGAVLRTEAPGRADAVARLGGPFAYVQEYVTPEEASQQLGRLIVGAPTTPDDPYDLEAVFTLFKGGGAETHTVTIAGTTGPHLIETSFAFEGDVAAMWWEAEVALAWRGETITYTHQSKPILPAITVWRVLVYDRDERVLPLAQVMDEDGSINLDLDWQVYEQKRPLLKNINELHALLFFREHREALKANKPLAAYLVATIFSPEDRDAVFAFSAEGNTETYLNGQPADTREVDELVPIRVLGHPLHQSAAMHLRAGENVLVVRTTPSDTWPRWFFGGALVTPEGRLLTDLRFD